MAPPRAEWLFERSRRGVLESLAARLLADGIDVEVRPPLPLRMWLIDAAAAWRLRWIETLGALSGDTPERAAVWDALSRWERDADACALDALTPSPDSPDARVAIDALRAAVHGEKGLPRYRDGRVDWARAALRHIERDPLSLKRNAGAS